MAYDTAYMANPHTGQIKTAPIGFSWTMFFFGFFAPMIRGDWKWFGIIFGLAILAALISFGLLGWVPGIVGAFIWNRSYLNDLIGRGFKLKGAASGNLERIDGVAGHHAPRLDNMGI